MDELYDSMREELLEEWRQFLRIRGLLDRTRKARLMNDHERLPGRKTRKAKPDGWLPEKYRGAATTPVMRRIIQHEAVE